MCPLVNASTIPTHKRNTISPTCESVYHSVASSEAKGLSTLVISSTPCESKNDVYLQMSSCSFVAVARHLLHLHGSMWALDLETLVVGIRRARLEQGEACLVIANVSE